jgi:hypothetical protein
MAAAIPFVIAGISAYGAISQGQQASSAANANASLAKQQAQSALQQGVADEDRLRRQQAAFNGEARAQTAQSGTGFDGSNLDVARQNATLQQLDLLNTRYNAQLQASGLLAQADQDTIAANNAKKNATLSAVGSIAGGYGNSLRNKSVLNSQRTGYGSYGSVA